MGRAAIALLAVAAIAASCSFPEPTIVGPGDDGGGSSSSGSTSSGSSSGDGGRIDAASCAEACDCDQDGVKASRPDCAGGSDCDDYDPRAKPGAEFRADLPSPPLNGNWNCDATIEKRWEGDVNCSLGSDCTRQGFTGPQPECGQEAEWVECEPAAATLCRIKGAPAPRKQECR